MSSDIWTRCEGSSEIGSLVSDPWRVVEAQHQIATRKLVGSDAEQALLEEVLERYKPPLIAGAPLHYLLFTPFRYPPLPHGSRFGTRGEPGIWYGAETLHAAFAEIAYYRLLFLDGTDADLGPLAAELTVYQVPLRTRRGVDLTAAPFSRFHAALASKTSYAATQPLGAAMRDAGVEAFRYHSARDSDAGDSAAGDNACGDSAGRESAGGVNIAVISPRAFGSRRPRGLQTWRSVSTPAVVELSRRDYFERGAFRFLREAFLVDGVLPRPAV
jgi:hypothetical protein